jgi:hypothetical protein
MSYCVPDFLLAERDWLSTMRTRYRKPVGGLKYTKSGFYSNDSLNNDLNSEFKKDS